MREAHQAIGGESAKARRAIAERVGAGEGREMSPSPSRKIGARKGDVRNREVS